MLKAQNRLRKARDIARVYKQGQYGSGEGLLSVKAVRGVAPQSRAVVVVGKKIDKRAVVRNTIRRRLVGALNDIWATVPPGCDIVVSVHSDVSHLEAARLRDLLAGALRRAGVTANKLRE